jgi:hypothetical protein
MLSGVDRGVEKPCVVKHARGRVYIKVSKMCVCALTLFIYTLEDRICIKK